MQAFVIEQPRVTEFTRIPEPEPRPGEVLLRVKTVGFCGSDLATFRGANPLVTYPRIPGHEVAGMIESVTPGVPGHFEPGSIVTVSPYTACGKCSACRQDRSHCCRYNQTLGVQRDGVFTELFTSSWQQLILTGNLSIPAAALVEPLSVGFHAVNRGRVTGSDIVAVFGCGAIGLGAIAGASFRGARVIAIDVDDDKLTLARLVGATHTINSANTELHPALQELTDGDGPCVCVEAVGLPETFREAADEVCFAGRVVYIGYTKRPTEFLTRVFVQKELDILGSRNARPEDFSEVGRMLEKGDFPIDSVITRTYEFAEADSALADWDSDPSDITKLHVRVNP
jgi:threonine dehydrogenase-like Zn-dependent dehydrogenase